MNAISLWNTLSVEPDQVTADEDPALLFRQYIRRQYLLKDVVTGAMHPDDLLDCLMDDGISPDGYLDYLDDALREVA